MLGNDVRETYRTDLIPIIVGLLIGFLIGQFPIYILMWGGSSSLAFLVVFY